MSYVPVQYLLTKSHSLYKLVVLAAKRASELNNGALKLVDMDRQKVANVALEEIAQGKITWEKGK